MKQIIKGIVPVSAWQMLRQLKRATGRSLRRSAELAGYNVARKGDYYSPLPTETAIRLNQARWNKPSSLAGVQYDLDVFRQSLEHLVRKYWDEFSALTPYSANKKVGFGPGYTELDAMLLYMMIRELAPRRYMEVGSGLSTYYCSLAARENAKREQSVEITCVEPFPFEKLNTIPGIRIIRDEVQNVGREEFLKLEAGDVLFIDSSHAVRVDSDVPYLILEILPIIKPGVLIHIHDIPFPYNIPYPAEFWVLGTAPGAPYWPIYWNEAMLLQAFLAFNHEFEIIQSLPLLRYFDEKFVKELVPAYRSVAEVPNTFSSIWLKRKA